MQDAGCRMPDDRIDSGYSLQVTGYWLLVTGY